MEVIYDISVLAQAPPQSRTRAGVLRVVDNVARGLAASSDCNVSFCLVNTDGEPIDFLANDSQLRDTEVLLAWPAQLRQRLHRNKLRLTRIIESDASAATSFAMKAVRKSLDQATALTRLSHRVVSKDVLSRTDIYHSPFSPIPEQTRAAPRVKNFLTVYDVIPIRYPELCQPGAARTVRQSIGTLRPEDFVLCISQSTKDDLCDHRRDCDPARFFVTRLAASQLFHPCTDLTRLAAVRGKYNIGGSVPYFLSLSTLEPRKNIVRVLNCFSRLVQQQGLNDLRLVLVGARGWDYDAILNTVAGLGSLADQIIVTGYVDDEDLAALYSGALGFVYLSLYEGFGLPPLEAMQCGIPVITSNTSSLPEVVDDAGIMLDPLDEDGICQAMLTLYDNAELRAELSTKSLRRAAQFSWDRCIRETITAYKTALGN